MEIAARSPAAAYSTAVEGGRHVAMRYAITGAMEMSAFLDFVADRAAWLNIAGWAEANGPRALTVVAAGPEALVGALEMALTLGPLTALVDNVLSVTHSGPVGPAFELRSSPGSPAC